MTTYQEPHNGFYTHEVCNTLNNLDREQAICAIHCAWIQLRALDQAIKYADDESDICSDLGHYDQKPALLRLEACLRQAGHPGFID